MACVSSEDPDGMWFQRRPRSAWASAQSDQSLRCPDDKAWVLSYPLSAQRRLIRLSGCPGWSKSSLGAHATLLVLSWGGSYLNRVVLVYNNASKRCRRKSKCSTYEQSDLDLHCLSRSSLIWVCTVWVEAVWSGSALFAHAYLSHKIFTVYKSLC